MYLSNSELGKTISKGKKTIFVVLVFSLVLGLVFERARTPNNQITVPLVIAPVGEKETSEFNYDHYYSLEAVDTLTDSLEEWLKSGAVKNEVKNKTKATFRSADWRFLENGNWSVRKKAPQLVEVHFATQSEKDAREVEKALREKASSFLSSLDQMKEPHFNLTNPTSEIEFSAPRWGFITVLSLLWGTILGIILVLAKSEREERKKIN